MSNPIKLSRVGPQGKGLKSYMQCANLINELRQEYRDNDYKELFIEREYEFASRQIRKVSIHFTPDEKLPGIYSEDLRIDGQKVTHLDWSKKGFFSDEGPGSDDEPF